ncbi:MAG: hypothetical protein M3Z02_00585 [Actinomycetota bacterium]|nr:hypothetical protein [Actinomycetota bacterium]
MTEAPAVQSSRALAVFDVDGVLADVRHRLPLLDTRPRDWARFFAAATEDPPLAQGVALARELELAYEVVYVTGRPERCRQDTLDWLARHGLPAGRLLMRPDPDRRPARVLKAGLLGGLARAASIAVVVDDDVAVCAALRQRGHPVLLADWMPRAEVMDEAQERLGRT